MSCVSDHRCWDNAFPANHFTLNQGIVCWPIGTWVSPRSPKHPFTAISTNKSSALMIHYLVENINWLVVFRHPVLKNMSSSIGMMKATQYMGKFKKWQPKHQPDEPLKPLLSPGLGVSENEGFSMIFMGFSQNQPASYRGTPHDDMETHSISH